MSEHPVKKYKDESGRVVEGWYIYRGTHFRRRDDVPTGYYGRYTILGGMSFTKLSEVKVYIDQKFLSKA